MPSIIYGNNVTSNGYVDLNSVNYEYDYKGLDLKPGSPFHQKLRDKILERARLGYDTISKRFPYWNELDRLLTAFVDLDEEEKRIKAKDDRKPVSIVYPYTYAITDTLVSYLFSLLYQDPIIRYEGVSPEDTMGAILLEKIIQLHCDRFRFPLNLHTLIRDAIIYNLGVSATSWMIKEKRIGSMTKVYEGNKLITIDPYSILPDPNNPIDNVQNSEFFGYIIPENLMSLLRQEQNGDYFNVKYLKHYNLKRTSIYALDQSKRNLRIGNIPQKETSINNPVDVIFMYIDLIPKDWELGDYEYPEKWIFGLAADEIIIQAAPSGLNHGEFPIVTSCPEFDGHSFLNISRLESLAGLQTTLDWLLNSHIKNVRKAVNDRFIIDPYQVNLNDIINSQEGGIIRLRRPAYGKGVKDVVQQFPTVDITANHLRDASMLMEAMNKVSGMDGSTMGMLREGGPERLTSSEFKGTRAGTTSRIDRISKIFSLQALQPIGYQFASNVQQFMSEQTYIDTTGRWKEVLLNTYKDSVNSGKILADPMQLMVDYDVVVKDSTTPQLNDVDAIIRTLQVLGQNPEVAQTLDMAKIALYIMRTSGAKNIDNFVKVKVMPDEQVAKAQQQGRMVPIEQANSLPTNINEGGSEELLSLLNSQGS